MSNGNSIMLEFDSTPFGKDSNYQKKFYNMERARHVTSFASDKIDLKQLEKIRLFNGFIPASVNALETVMCLDSKTGHM